MRLICRTRSTTDGIWLDGSMVNNATVQLSNYTTKLFVSTTLHPGNDFFVHIQPSVDFAVVLSIITVMKLIEDIKKAEEKAEKLKKEAQNKGEELLEKARKTSEEAFAALDETREKLLNDKLAEARTMAEKEIKKARRTHETEIKKIRDSFKSKKDQAVKKVQEILLKWPSSQ